MTILLHDEQINSLLLAKNLAEIFNNLVNVHTIFARQSSTVRFAPLKILLARSRRFGTAIRH
jgi:hypothetical protein